MMKIGFNEATARDCSTLEEDILLCEQAGFDAIELRIDMLKAYLQDHSRAELLAMLRSKRICPVNLNAIYPYAELFSDGDDPEKRACFLEDFEFACELAQYTGAKALVLCPPLLPDRRGCFPGTLEAQNQMNVRIISGLCDRIAHRDIRLCFEIVGASYSSCRTIAQAQEILRRVHDPRVGLTIDSYNIYMGDLDKRFSAIQQLRAEEIFVAHINDADWVPEDQLGDQSRRCFCGSGFLDLDAYLTQLKKIGYEGVVSIETFRPEYWARTARWVIDEAYRTTYGAMKHSQCLE